MCASLSLQCSVRTRAVQLVMLCFQWATLAAVSGCEQEFPPPWTPEHSKTSPAEIASYHDELSAPATPTLRAERFLGAEACGACHTTHVAEWRTSPHAKAMHDPVFQKLLQLQREQRGSPQLDRFCVQCHSPIASRSGGISPGFDFEALSPLAREGVTCEVCHRTREVERPFNAGLSITDDGVLRGPFRDAEAPHATEYSETFAQSELCASCHDVTSASGVKLESPFEEWLGSKAASESRTCQSCHMPAYEGRAAPQLGSASRELHRHRFVAIEPDAKDAHDAQDTHHANDAGDLASAARVEADFARDDAGKLVLNVRVRSRLDGHNFPTGSVFFRQVWLSVSVRDARDRVVFRSGQLDAQGDLSDLHDLDHANEDPQLQVFGGYLRDESGQPTLFPWAAASLDSFALAPLETRHLTYHLEEPSSGQPLQAEVTLRFRPFSPRLLRAIGADEQLDTLWTADIDRSTATWSQSSKAEPVER